MNHTFFKRIGAYVPFLNPSRDAYSEKYNELVNLQEQYTSNEISLDEYNQAFVPIAYEIYRYNTYYVIIDLVCTLLYFGVLQFFCKGQTIGKKLFQIRVVSNDERPLTIVNFILRTVVLSNMIISIALQCIVHFMDVDHYYMVYENVNLVGSIILYIMLFMIVVRADGRGLHDFVANTKVVLDDPQVKEDKVEAEQKIIDLEAKEEKKSTPKKKTKKGTKKE